jgi:hypothetical protein
MFSEEIPNTGSSLSASWFGGEQHASATFVDTYTMMLPSYSLSTMYPFSSMPHIRFLLNNSSPKTKKLAFTS